MLKVAEITKLAKVRSDPNEKACLVGFLVTGNVVSVLDEDCGWSLVQFKKKYSETVVGWVRNEVLSLVAVDGDTRKSVSDVLVVVGIVLTAIRIAIIIASMAKKRDANG